MTLLLQQNETPAMTNRTKNASTEDDNDNTGPLVLWAVKLTADLTDDEKTALKNHKHPIGSGKGGGKR